MDTVKTENKLKDIKLSNTACIYMANHGLTVILDKFELLRLIVELRDVRSGCSLGGTRYQDLTKDIELLNKALIEAIRYDYNQIETTGKSNDSNIEAKNGDPVNPEHYDFTINGVKCDLFDIAHAMGLSPIMTNALKYFRKKENKIQDLKKAIKCLEREMEFEEKKEDAKRKHHLNAGCNNKE